MVQRQVGSPTTTAGSTASYGYMDLVVLLMISNERVEAQSQLHPSYPMVAQRSVSLFHAVLLLSHGTDEHDNTDIFFFMLRSLRVRRRDKVGWELGMNCLNTRLFSHFHSVLWMPQADESIFISKVQISVNIM